LGRFPSKLFSLQNQCKKGALSPFFSTDGLLGSAPYKLASLGHKGWAATGNNKREAIPLAAHFPVA
jgi:hypothetical protein